MCGGPGRANLLVYWEPWRAAVTLWDGDDCSLTLLFVPGMGRGMGDGGSVSRVAATAFFSKCKPRISCT